MMHFMGNLTCHTVLQLHHDVIMITHHDSIVMYAIVMIIIKYNI